MKKIKKFIKKLFVFASALVLLDRFLYLKSKIKYFRTNRSFKKENGDFRLPPDYYLYETYKLNYREYKEDGLQTAKEIIEWSKNYGCEFNNIMEWGCGVARIVRHLPSILSTNVSITGIDINQKMIDWNKSNITDVHFKVIDYTPPTEFESDSFDLIYALSVFTHIERKDQERWLKEVHRLLKSGGIFLFTTHGRYFLDKLDTDELKDLNKLGSYTINYHKRGHRMMTTYNDSENFRLKLEGRFTVLEFSDGENNISKIGGQDLWIVKKN